MHLGKFRETFRHTFNAIVSHKILGNTLAFSKWSTRNKNNSSHLSQDAKEEVGVKQEELAEKSSLLRAWHTWTTFGPNLQWKFIGKYEEFVHIRGWGEEQEIKKVEFRKFYKVMVVENSPSIPWGSRGNIHWDDMSYGAT